MERYIESAFQKAREGREMRENASIQSECLSKLWNTTSKLLSEVKETNHTGNELLGLYSKLTGEITRLLEFIGALKLPQVKPRQNEFTDGGPGVGVSNFQSRFRSAEWFCIHSLDRLLRVHRVTGDSSQKEAERMNAAIGNAMVDGRSL